MSQFPHLRFSQKISGLYKSKRQGRPSEINASTQEHLNNREVHGSYLTSRLDTLSDRWKNNISNRTQAELPDLPDSNVVPVFLQVDAKEFDVESLKNFGIEIIAEEENGFIIGASSDDFLTLRQKIAKFVAEEGTYKNKASQLWKIEEDQQWRVEQILSGDLREKWNTISDTDEFIVDIGIACYVRISDQPDINKEESETEFKERLKRWKEKKEQVEAKRSELQLDRENKFEALIRAYGGELLSSYVDAGDSFSCRIKISGKGLKDIVLNYQYLFEVSEANPLVVQETDTNEIDEVNPELVAPPEGAPRVCIIDSGIQEEHRLLSLAIDAPRSFSFIDGDTSTADVVTTGGHGTKVAGAVLYPNGIPRQGTYQLPFFIQNARVMVNIDGRPVLPKGLFPPELMEKIVAHYGETRIFNMSINESRPCRLVHMSAWGASIDTLMHSKDVLFILSAGNLLIQTDNMLNPGIREHLEANRDYPSYLLESSSRIGNPAQSSFALTVGSICSDEFDDGAKASFGKRDNPSSFSRTGLGPWGMIKPDVVEYAGDFVREKTARQNISHESSIAPELVRSTAGGGSEIGRDGVGTSFAAPKVANIAANLQALYPEESSNLYRALIVQSARLPEEAFVNPNFSHIQHFGYGVPSLERATENSSRRITLIASGKLAAKQAYVYSVKVPSAMRSPGEDYDVLVEFTLAFTARPRRTRRGTHSYLSTWLDWESSRLNENYNQFSQRMIKDLEESEEQDEDRNSIKWVIREKKDWGIIKDLKRQDSTLQKGWCRIKSNQLPEFLSFAVVGHAGWEPDLDKEVPYSVAVSFEALSADINVYEMIRIENEIELPVEVEQEVTT